MLPQFRSVTDSATSRYLRSILEEGSERVQRRILHRKAAYPSGKGDFPFRLLSHRTMIAGNPIRARGVRVLLAFAFILLVVLTILLLQEKRSPSTPSKDPPLHTAVLVEHLSAS